MSEEPVPVSIVVEELAHTIATMVAAAHSRVLRVAVPTLDQYGLYSRTPSQVLAGQALHRVLHRHLTDASIGEETRDQLLVSLVRDMDFLQITTLNSLGYFNRGGVLSARREAVDVDEVVAELTDLFEAQAAEKNVEFRAKVGTGLLIIGDYNLLRRMFANLLHNAIKYSYEADSRKDRGRFIKIDARRHSIEGDVLVAISSYGVGIDPDEITTGAIFEYGYRGRRASDRERSGAGIGLAEAKRIVEAHGGHLRVESHKVPGSYVTTVSVFLPAK